MKYIYTILLMLIFGIKGICQEKLTYDLSNTCSYYGEDLKDEDIYSFASTREAVQVIDDIVGALGLKRNFTIRAANVPNALAKIDGTQRVILYSQSFINAIEQGTKTNWSGISILAHEIAHHLNGHTLLSTGSRPSIELEADEFSGHVLYVMGCPSLDLAQSAMNLLSSDQGSATHPPKSARLEAIALGWKKASEKFPRESARELPRTSPRVSTSSGRPAAESLVNVSFIESEGKDEHSAEGIIYHRAFNIKNNSDQDITVNIELEYGFYVNCQQKKENFDRRGAIRETVKVRANRGMVLWVKTPKLKGHPPHSCAAIGQASYTADYTY